MGSMCLIVFVKKKRGNSVKRTTNLASLLICEVQQDIKLLEPSNSFPVDR